MDVDEDEEGTQRPKRVADFGIEVDFDSLDDDEREVCNVEDAHHPRSSLTRFVRPTLRKLSPTWTTLYLSFRKSSSGWLRT